MIIVEGPDGSGKSTLITSLSYTPRKLRALRGGPGADGINKGGWGGTTPTPIAYARQIMQANREEHTYPPHSHRIAFDRFHLSEIVYGPMLRGQEEFTEETIASLNTFIHRYRIPVILCLPPFAVTLANVRQPGRHVPAYQTDDFLRTAYRAFYRLMPWATHVYDYTIDPLPVSSYLDLLQR